MLTASMYFGEDSPAFVAPSRVSAVRDSFLHLREFLTKNAEVGYQSDGDDSFWGDGDSFGRPYRVVNGTLMIPIMGLLLSRFPYSLGEWATGYPYIKAAFDRGLTDPNVQRIAFISHSPGGSGAGLFELADYIHENRAVKPTRTFASDWSASAAYALGSSAQQMFMSRSGLVGSIGAVIMHVSFEEMLKGAGVDITFIYAGKYKVDGNPYQELSESAKKEFQLRVDRGYENFVNLVARNRGMSDKEVRDTEARVFDSVDAPGLGLVDGIVELPDGLTIFQDVEPDDTDEDDEMTAKDTTTSATPPKEVAANPGISPADLEAAVKNARDLALEEGRKAGQTETTARLSAILALPETTGRLDLAMELALETDLPAEKVQKVLAKSPQSGPAAKTPTDSKDHFATVMDADKHPDVGAAEGGDADPNDPVALGQQLLADRNAYIGISAPSKAS